MHRAQSVSSNSSVASIPPNLTSTVVSDDSSLIPPTKQVITRRRLSPTQAAALNKLFQAKSHPLKDERMALAAEIGIDFKAVTIWFQNKRQITKRNLQASKENVPPSNHERSAHHNTTRSTKSRTGRTQVQTLSRPAICLDHIADRLQRPAQNTPASPSYPLTPHKPSHPPLSVRELWKRMASSPVVPPSPPSADSMRFGVLPSHSRTMRSLEWACARARINPKKDEDIGHADILDFPPLLEVPGTELSDSTDTDVEEAITPDSSVDYFATNGLSNNTVGDTKEAGKDDSIEGNDVHPSEVEAAMVLLGFKAQR